MWCFNYFEFERSTASVWGASPVKKFVKFHWNFLNFDDENKAMSCNILSFFSKVIPQAKRSYYSDVYVEFGWNDRTLTLLGWNWDV